MEYWNDGMMEVFLSIQNSIIPKEYNNNRDYQFNHEW